MKGLCAWTIPMILLASVAQAAPITVSAGDFVVFNFDMTTDTPSPPYSRVGVGTQTTGLDFEPPPCSGPNDECALLDIGEWRFFTELNGTGELFAVHQANLGGFWNASEMTDGVFSATLQMTEGSIAVEPIVCGIAPDGGRTANCPRVPPPTVPEPATLPLLTVVASAGFLRLRRCGRSGLEKRL